MAKKEQLIVVLKQVTPIAGGGTGNCRGMGMRSVLPFAGLNVSSSEART